MSVLVDTGVFYAHHDRDASRHDDGERALARVLNSTSFGRVVTSDYVFDEAMTLTLRRTGRVGDAIELGKRPRGDGYPDAIEILHASPAHFDCAFDLFETYDEHQLSFTDAITLALVEDHELDAVLSFDDDFDGLVDRLHPAEVAEAD